MSRVLIAIPLKAFTAAKGRLAALLERDARTDLARATAAHVVGVGSSIGVDVAVVTDDDDVSAWADGLGVPVIADPGTGLDDAAKAAMGHADGSWCILHGDLPLLTPSELESALSNVGPGNAVLGPSRDGGTNVLAASEPIEPAYGRSSFTRHLRATAHLRRHIVVTPGTVVDIDGPDDLRRAAHLRGGEWLQRFLGSPG